MKIERPEPVLALDAMMVEIADSDGWTRLTKPKNNSNIPEMDIIENEVVVELKLGVLADEWAVQYSEYELSVVRKVSPQRAYWLVNYNTNKIDPETFMDKLRSDKDVLNAEFNKKVDVRED